LFIPGIAELRREDDPAEMRLQNRAYQSLILAEPVGIGGIEEGDAEGQSALQGPDGFLVISSAVIC
jgi:hypothetical protein